MATRRTSVTRRHKRVFKDQYDSALRDFLACEDEYRRWRMLEPMLGHRTTDADWERFEDLRTEWMHARDADLTTGDVAQMAELSVETIVGMAERGEMPAPCHRGRWHWWWDREDITAWLARRGVEEPAGNLLRVVGRYGGRLP